MSLISRLWLFLKDFSSGGPNSIKFHTQSFDERWKKNYIFAARHMTKMADTIYAKNL